jgi:hypothetical protein
MYFLNGKYMTEEPLMGDVASDPIALELLRVQRGRLADRLRPPWWYLAGIAVTYALVFAFPFAARFLGVGMWPFVVAVLAVALPAQWGMNRVTGIKIGFRNLRYPASGRPTRIAVVVVSLGAIVTEHFLIDRGLPLVAGAVAAVAVAAEVALVQVTLRGIRQELRDGGAPA